MTLLCHGRGVQYAFRSVEGTETSTRCYLYWETWIMRRYIRTSITHIRLHNPYPDVNLHLHLPSSLMFFAFCNLSLAPFYTLVLIIHSHLPFLSCPVLSCPVLSSPLLSFPFSSLPSSTYPYYSLSYPLNLISSRKTTSRPWPSCSTYVLTLEVPLNGIRVETTLTYTPSSFSVCGMLCNLM